jgi:hypothetical protein
MGKTDDPCPHSLYPQKLTDYLWFSRAPELSLAVGKRCERGVWNLTEKLVWSSPYPPLPLSPRDHLPVIFTLEELAREGARWGRLGGLETFALYGPGWFVLLARRRRKKLTAAQLEEPSAVIRMGRS